MDTWSVRRPDHVQAGGVGWIPSPEGHVSDTHARVGALCPQTSEKRKTKVAQKTFQIQARKRENRNMGKNRVVSVRWTLVVYDLIIMAMAAFLVFWPMHGSNEMTEKALFVNLALFCFVIFTARVIGQIYTQIWRYGGTRSYVRLIVTEVLGFVVYFAISRATPVLNYAILPMTAFVALDLLGVLVSRMMYRYCYKCGTNKTAWGRFLLLLLRIFAHIKDTSKLDEARKINVAILGAGSVGIALCQEITSNKNSMYEPRCFIDINKSKVGRYVHGLKIYDENDNLASIIQDHNIQEVIFAVQDINEDHKKELYEFFRKAGCKILVYDAPQIDSADGKPHLRDFGVEELLFRPQQFVVDEKTKAYYHNKVILITGGGGSIGSELCRQLAEMGPKQLIILDIYENGAYDVQQELRIKYKGQFDIAIEICSITNKVALQRVFETYHPQIVINAAAHKHVPLMEHNCIEAIENNVFGCQNVIECCEEFGSERFMMVSTDKAVNPTNVMGATKRMCEMLTQVASATGKVKYSATRFGNVLGSAGSVIPLFKRQIAAGGPVTITDRRITRFFMTIPEASQLVLASGAMAKNGDLFVLDMGEPVKIIDLAESMIKLSGARNVEIIETGLRPGEKLYEELLIKTEKLDKTENEKIFIEHDTPLTAEEVADKMIILTAACTTDDDDKAREALRSVVPTFKKPEVINYAVGKA